MTGLKAKALMDLWDKPRGLVELTTQDFRTKSPETGTCGKRQSLGHRPISLYPTGNHPGHHGPHLWLSRCQADIGHPDRSAEPQKQGPAGVIPALALQRVGPTRKAGQSDLGNDKMAHRLSAPQTPTSRKRLDPRRDGLAGYPVGMSPHQTEGR